MQIKGFFRCCVSRSTWRPGNCPSGNMISFTELWEERHVWQDALVFLTTVKPEGEMVSCASCLGYLMHSPPYNSQNISLHSCVCKPCSFSRFMRGGSSKKKKKKRGDVGRGEEKRKKGKWVKNQGKGGTSLLVQWLRLHASSVGGPGLISVQGTRYHIPQLKDLACCH